MLSKENVFNIYLIVLESDNYIILLPSLPRRQSAMLKTANKETKMMPTTSVGFSTPGNIQHFHPESLTNNHCFRYLPILQLAMAVMRYRVQSQRLVLR